MFHKRVNLPTTNANERQVCILQKHLFGTADKYKCMLGMTDDQLKRRDGPQLLETAADTSKLDKI